MLTFKNLASEIVKFLTGSNPAVSVEFGKFGNDLSVLPQNPPCLWVYLEPSNDNLKNYNLANINNKAVVNIFVCASAGSDASLSAFLEAVELAETVLDQMMLFPAYANNLPSNADSNHTSINFPQDLITIDGIYNDLAVVCLTVNINYCKHI